MIQTSTMRSRLLGATLAIAAAGLLPGTSAAAPGDVGTPAAPYNLSLYGGGTHSLSQDAGKVVLLFVMGYS